MRTPPSPSPPPFLAKFDIQEKAQEIGKVNTTTTPPRCLPESIDRICRGSFRSKNLKRPLIEGANGNFTYQNMRY